MRSTIKLVCTACYFCDVIWGRQANTPPPSGGTSSVAAIMASDNAYETSKLNYVACYLHYAGYSNKVTTQAVFFSELRRRNDFSQKLWPMQSRQHEQMQCTVHVYITPVQIRGAMEIKLSKTHKNYYWQLVYFLFLPDRGDSAHSQTYRPQ